MENSSASYTGSVTPLSCNGSPRRASPAPLASPTGRPASLTDHAHCQPHVVRVVVNRDDRGYGMKVSGDNPVFVQSVKDGGAAERAGLQAGDKIIKVNGVNVMHSTHTEVVALIRSSSQVVLTVQQKLPALRTMGSPSMHVRPLTTPSSARITGPQPVDHEKQYQLQQEKEQYYRLMIEKEQHYLDLLRSQIATSPDDKKCSELAKTERNLQTLQAMLHRSQAEQQSPSPDPHSPMSPPRPTQRRALSPNGNTELPPPLPKRNNPPRQRSNTLNNTKQKPLDVNALFISYEINANVTATASDSPPPLPPRNQINSAPITNLEDAVNSINKQMSYPLVATCATLVNDYSPNSHHRTKSSPDSLLGMGGAEGLKKHSGSATELNRQEWEGTETPPGTPPPPYPSPPSSRRGNNGGGDEADNTFEESLVNESSPDISPLRGNASHRVLADGATPIHAANPQTAQQPIISMEDDEISDQEISQLEDHGHFKSLSRLWEHPPHLAVFTNYVISNSDPNSLLFYLLTDLYKEGNVKEMRKWAFEIHSSFLVPGAPLHLANVDEHIALEIDHVLNKESDREERLRKIFWKARSRAKEELTRQLMDFQQKRTAGLGTMFGPTDQDLQEVYYDKTKETKLYESLLLQKLEPYLDEVDKESCDPRRYYTAAALATVLQRVFQIRPAVPAMDRLLTFVNKERSFRTKFIGKYSRKWNILGHQFVAQQYYTVIHCSYCHQIIYGIGPQGYQCSACLINLHRSCVKLYDDTCPGPITKKDRGIRKLIGMRHDSNDRMKKTSHFIQMEKERRQLEERDSSFDATESGDVKPGQPVSRSGSDRRPDAVHEENLKHQDSGTSQDSQHESAHKNDTNTPESSVSLPASGSKRKVGSNINRSESVKEQSEKRKQRRNISDPSHNTSCDVDLDGRQGLAKNTDSGSSSNSSISCNGRLSESPCNSVDVVHQTAQIRTNTDSDSDMDGETDPLNWQQLVTEEELKNLNSHEKKRQDVINELFHTESSHVRFLKVLYKIFYKKLQESQVLKQDELNLIFPNIREMLDIHTEFNKEMRRKRKEDPLVKELGEMLLKMFAGAQGESLQKAAATFCERQQLALEFIKKRRERDSKFDAVLTNCEKKRQCRRLQLQGIIPTEMQRLSKYPLLLERLVKSVEANTDTENSEELSKLQRSHNASKDILNYVNEAAKVALNHHRLEEIQKHLDTSSFERADHEIVNDFRTLDLTRYRLVLEGSMQLRRPNKPVVPVHILLLEEMVVILHREGDRFLLKFFQSGSPAQPQPLSPIIKINTLLVRINAVCKNALFLVNTSTNNSQMYDLIAEDESKREVWFKHFSDAADAYNRREGRSKRHLPTADDSDSEVVQELPSTGDVSERAEAVTVDGDRTGAEELPVKESGEGVEKEAESGGEGAVTKEDDEETPAMVAGGGAAQPTRVTAEDWPLVQPSQVSVVVPPVHVAESTLTHLEQIRRKDALVKQALADKEGLVADMLHIPREHFQHIADMAGEETPSTGGDLTQRILASIYQVSTLQKAVNEALNVTETEAVAARGGRQPACVSQERMGSNGAVAVPSIPASLVADVAAALNAQLTKLLSDSKTMEEDRDRLRKELHKVRERYHEELHLHGPVQLDDSVSDESTQDIFCEASSGEKE